MKLKRFGISKWLVCLVSIVPVIDATPSDNDVKSLLERMEAVDTSFQENGSSLTILQDYDSILLELIKLSNDDNNHVELLNSKITNVLYRHGLINYSLKRDNLALHDFESCIDYNNHGGFHAGCFEKFMDISFDMGNFNQIRLKLDSFGTNINEDVYNKLNKKLRLVENLEEIATKSCKETKFDQCIESSNQILLISSSNIKVRNLQNECIKNSKSLDFNTKINSLITNYLNIINNNDQNLTNYVELYKLQFFGKALDPSNLNKIMKNCLKLDNDFANCRQYSKIGSKFSKLMEIYNEISIYYSHIYLDTEEKGDLAGIEELEPSTDSWQKLNDILFNKDMKIKLRPNEHDLFKFDITSHKNNFEVLMQLIVDNLKDFNLTEDQILLNSKFLRELLRMGRESFYHLDKPKTKTKRSDFDSLQGLKKITELNKEKLSKEIFLPDQLPKIDKLIKRKSYAEAQKLLDVMKEQFKKTKLWKKRHEVVDREYGAKLREQEEQRRRQQQRQREEYFRQQQNQRQHQQHQNQRSEPKSDYYKILGVSKDADDATIKKAYRDKMRQSHPDKLRKSSNLSQDEIETNVAEINNAYEVLSDPDQKSNYDRYGDDPNEGGGRPPPAGEPQFNFRGGNPFFTGGRGGKQQYHGQKFAFKSKKTRVHRGR